jgi:nucleotide-binding universal stress UspA family protein
LARERKAPLLFLFIVDPAFAKPAGDDLAAAVLDEFEHLGRGLLAIAQARARTHGVQADIAICRGAIQQAIEGFLREVNAGTLVIGAPKNDSMSPVFNSAAISRFVQRIQASGDIEVLVVE